MPARHIKQGTRHTLTWDIGNRLLRPNMGEAHIDPKRRANYAALLLIRDTLVMVAQALVATAAAAHAKGHLKERPQASMRVSRSLIRCKLEGDAVTSLKHTASMPTN